MEFRLVYVTARTRDEALTIARTVVQERLAASANVFESMTAVYWWADELNEVGETVIILKTRHELLEALTDRIRGLHSYNAPCIVAMPIVGGNADYLRWIASETGEHPLH